MTLTLIVPERVQRLLGPEPSGTPGEGGVLLDAVLEEAVEHKADVTAFPVELGADITDHVIVQPARYRMTGAITDTPTTYEGTTYAHPAATLRSKAAWALLVDLMAFREPFTIDTGFLRYEDMIIEGLESKKNATIEGAIIFDAQLLQLNIVGTAVTPISEAVRQAGQAADGADAIENNGMVKGKTLGAAVWDGISEFFTGATP